MKHTKIFAGGFGLLVFPMLAAVIFYHVVVGQRYDADVTDAAPTYYLTFAVDELVLLAGADMYVRSAQKANQHAKH